MRKYNLSFIKDEDLFKHVMETVNKYRFRINLNDFKKNIIDPIKLTFDAKIYNKSLAEVIEAEILRQLDKSNTNLIGYFHQNIFKYFDSEWTVPKSGFDIINESKLIYVEMKNKHNTMNSSSSQKLYMKMQSTLIKEPRAQCLLVEVLAKKSQNIKWKISLDGESISQENIRKISIDKFYSMVIKEEDAFKNLCEKLPLVIEDVIFAIKIREKSNTVFSELENISPNLLKSIYLLAFNGYNGFEDFKL